MIMQKMEQKSQAIFTTACFAPVAYYALFNRADVRYIESHENYIKQTYRNRFEIASANGRMSLTIPVEKTGNVKTNIRDIKLSDHGDWHRMHWYSIESAYNSSPFFEYYADDIRPFFEKKEKWLFDYNEEIRLKLCELLEIDPQCQHTETYIEDFSAEYEQSDLFRKITTTDSGSVKKSAEITSLNKTGDPVEEIAQNKMIDLRQILQPKATLDSGITKNIIKPYYQVFDRKFGFIPNLSILDLLFNMGPESILYL